MNLSIKHLQWSCFATPEEIALKSGATRFASGKRFYLYKDNGANVLAVAHLDTVVAAGKKYGGVVDLENGPTFFNPYLDDRAGVFTMLFQLPSLGVTVDWLFTDEEESGATTAALFTPTKKYNWLVEFDRMGGDVVTYAYGGGWYASREDGSWDDTLTKAGFKVGVGSFSDIGALQRLGVKAVNIGVGYQDPHTSRAYIELFVYARQIGLFVDFWNKNKDKRFEHQEKTISYGRDFYQHERRGFDFFDSGAGRGRLTKKQRRALRKNFGAGSVDICASCRNLIVAGQCIMCGGKEKLNDEPGLAWAWCSICGTHTRHVDGNCDVCSMCESKDRHALPSSAMAAKQKADVITNERCPRCNKVTRFVNYQCEECAAKKTPCKKCGTLWKNTKEGGACTVCKEPFAALAKQEMSRYMCVACGATGMGGFPVVKCPSCGSPVAETKV